MPPAATETRQLILGTAGHIDHGKSALVRALTGVDTDRLPEEKKRGITIDIGFAHADVGRFNLGIIDVPGHERFVKNMLAGAVGVDVALLVVAADDSVMPQTREHLAILQLLGVQRGLIAITKSDLADDDWLALVEEELRELTAGTFLEGCPIVRTAAPPSGSPVGMDELRAAMEQVCESVDQRTTGAVFRLPIDRTFTSPGRGTVITGTVWSGELSSDEEVEWQPAGKPVRVRGLQNHGRDVDAIRRGQRAAVNLIGVHHTEIARGHELATPGFLKPSRVLTVDLHVLESSPWPVKHKSRQRLHLGTQEIMVSVSLLDGAAIEPGGRGVAQLFCAEPAVSICRQPFVLRAESPVVTIGGGRVLQPVAPRMGRHARSSAVRAARLKQLQSNEPVERADAAAFFYGTSPWRPIDLCRDAALELDEAVKVQKQMLDDGRTVALAVGPQRHLHVHRDVLAQLDERITDFLERYHREHALEAATPRARVIEALRLTDDAALANALMDRLIEQDTLRGDEQAVALAGFAPKLSDKQRQLRDTLIDQFRSAGVSPPSLDEVAAAQRVTEDQVRTIAELLLAERQLVHLGAGLYLHAEVEADMRRRVREALANGAGLTMSQLRDVLGTSRKYAVPIFEYLDRAGFTKRRGDLRVLAQ